MEVFQKFPTFHLCFVLISEVPMQFRGFNGRYRKECFRNFREVVRIFDENPELQRKTQHNKQVPTTVDTCTEDMGGDFMTMADAC